MADVRIKKQIMAALEHPEAEDGLYFSNLTQLYEEEERPAVEGDEESVLDALKELITEGKVQTSEGEAGVIFLKCEK